MHILRARIDLFGVLENQDITNLSPALSVFSGLNEAGKSTCLRFFKSMFFGYKRSKLNLDPMFSKKNSISGGSLFLSTEALGNIILTRRAEKDQVPLVYKGTLENIQETLDEQALQMIFQGLTPEVYDDVFAFDLKTLMDIGKLTGGDVRHALYAASLGLGSRSPAVILKELDNRMKDLFSKQNRAGSKALINAALDRLVEIQEVLNAEGPDMDLFNKLHREKENISLKIEQLHKTASGLRHTSRLAQRTISHWQHWEELQMLTASLHDVDCLLIDSLSLAPNSLERLENALQHKAATTNRLNEVNTSLHRLQDEYTTLHTHPILSLKGSLRKLLDRRSAQSQNVEKLYQALQTQKDLEQIISTMLQRLGPDWTINRAQNSVMNLLAREDIRGYEHKLINSKQAMQQTTQEVESLVEDIRLAEQAMQEPGLAIQTLVNIPSTNDMEKLTALKDAAEKSIEEIPGLLDKQKKTFFSLSKAMTDINPSWTWADVEYASSLPAGEAQLQNCLFSMENITKALETSQLELAAKSQELSRVQNNIEELSANYVAPANTVGEVEIKQIFQSLQELQQALLARETARQSKQQAASLLPNQATKPTSKPFVAALIFGGLASLGLGGYGMQSGENIYTLLGGVIVILTLFSLLAVFFIKKIRQTSHHTIFVMEQNATHLEKLQTEKISRIFQVYPLLHSFIEQSVGEQHSFTLKNFVEDLTPELISRLLGDIDEIRMQLLNQKNIENRIFELQEQLKASQIHVQTLHIEHIKLKDASEKALEQWITLLEGLHLPTSTTPQGMHGFFDKITSIKSMFNLYEENSNILAKYISTLSNPLEKAAQITFFQEDTQGFMEELNKYHYNNQDNTTNISNPFQTLLYYLQKLPGQKKNSYHILLTNLIMHENGLEIYADIIKKLTGVMAIVKEAMLNELKNKEFAARQAERLEHQNVLRLKLAKASKRKEQAFEYYQNIQKDWEQWLEKAGLSTHLSPETTLEALGVMEKALAKYNDINALQQRAHADMISISEFLKNTVNIALEAEIKNSISEHDFVILQDTSEHICETFELTSNNIKYIEDIHKIALTLLENAETYLENAEKSIIKKENIRQRIDEISSTLLKEQAVLENQETDVHNILKTAKVDNPEEFQVRFNHWQRRQQQSKLHALLKSVASDLQIDEEEFLDSFSKTSIEEAERVHSSAQEELLETEQTIKSLMKETGAIQERQNNLVNSRNTTNLRQEEAGLQERLQTLIGEWQSLALARHIFLGAKDVFEKESQHGVIGTAGQLFKQITAGEYHSIQLDVEKEQILAVHKNGSLKDPETALSQGTKEQLYLALRLAYIANHAKKAEAMPVIMDDILVNFDKKRMENTAEVLAEFSQNNQILFFTCHESTAATILKAGSQLKIQPKEFYISDGQIMPRQ